MVDKRIVETFQNVVSKFFEFCFRKVQGFHQLVEHYFVDVLADNRMLAGIADNIYARQVSYRWQYGVRTVQQGNFSFMVRSFRRYEQYVQSGFVGREFFGDFLWSFDNPQVENFALYNQVIIVL